MQMYNEQQIRRAAQTHFHLNIIYILILKRNCNYPTKTSQLNTLPPRYITFLCACIDLVPVRLNLTESIRSSDIWI